MLTILAKDLELACRAPIGADQLTTISAWAHNSMGQFEMRA